MARNIVKSIVVPVTTIAVYILLGSFSFLTAIIVSVTIGFFESLFLVKLIPEKSDGELQIDESNPQKDVYRLCINTDLDILKSKQKITLSVQKDVLLH